MKTTKEILNEIKSIFSNNKQEEPLVDAVADNDEIIEEVALEVETEEVVEEVKDTETEVEDTVEEVVAETEVEVALETVEEVVTEEVIEEVIEEKEDFSKELNEIKELLSEVLKSKTDLEDEIKELKSDNEKMKEDFNKLDGAQAIVDSPTITKTKSNFNNKMVERISNQRKNLGLSKY